jgi:hypothetical protein
MTLDSQDYADRFLQPKTAWEEVWHLWMVIVPRRSITGRLVHGLGREPICGRPARCKRFLKRIGA